MYSTELKVASPMGTMSRSKVATLSRALQPPVKVFGEGFEEYTDNATKLLQ